MEGFRAGRYELPVLYLDNHVLVVVKPRNMPVQADASGDTDLLSALKGYVGKRFQKPGNVYLGLVHRLDRPVGGVMVFARTSKAASRLSAAFQAHETEKLYRAVLRGRLTAPLELRDFLRKDEKTGMVSVVPETAPGAKEALLRSAPLGLAEGLTLAEVRLLTGRSHQIRVQHAAHGYPLWGDNRYGDGVPGQQIALWARELSFRHPTTKEALRFVAEPPAEPPWTLFENATKEEGETT